MRRRLEAIVHGRVHGVGFRQATRRVAAALGVSGAVRNLPNGAVHVVAEGDAAALADLLSWLLEGPERADVERVDAAWADAQGVDGDFVIAI